MSVASDVSDAWVVVLVAALSLGVVAQSDSHLALVVMTVVVAQWLALGEDVTSPWSVAVAAHLFLFHTLVALTAVTPHDSTVDPAVLCRWLARSGVVAASTGAVWLLVVAFESRDAAGNVALSVAAFSALAGAIVTFRALSLPRQSDRPS
jgi:hypothetical protein